MFGETNSEKRALSEVFTTLNNRGKLASVTRARDASGAKVDISTLFDETPPVTSFSKADK